VKLGRITLSLALGTIVVSSARAQTDTSGAIRLGVTGASAAQPGLVVLAGPGIDSVRMIVQRDLENSDRFTMPHLLDSAGTLHGQFNPASVKNFGLTWAVELEPAINGVDVKLYDVATGTIRQAATVALDPSGVGDTRLTIHRLSDQIVSWTGGIGIAATRIAFKLHQGKLDAIYRVDADGANMVRISPGPIDITPAWSPDGSRVSYSEYRDGRWTLYLQKLSTGSRAAVPSATPGDNYGGSFAPDGNTMTFSHGVEKGSDIESADIGRMCCAHQLTHEGARALALNVAPVYSPDGRRIAFNSTRTGTPEIWVMDNDGSSPQQLVPSNFDDTNGHPLDTYAPAWSPDGTSILFARDTPTGGRQLYSFSVGSGQVIKRTGTGRNEDPSWAPDSRHVVFKSTRSGTEQLWVMDIESGATRQLPTPGGAQYPAWSHSLQPNP
jgi:TolB protein